MVSPSALLSSRSMQRQWLVLASHGARATTVASTSSASTAIRATRLQPYLLPNQEVATTSTSTSASSEKAVATKDDAPPKGTRLQRIWASIKKEASHYWHGTKLLGKEIRISARIQGKLLGGKKLTRRERRQLKRTTQDLLRLIPFSVFLIVPFMELLLPVALKLFPNMLPSTFTDKFKEDEKKRKLLKVRLEMAKFLQETIRETGVKSADKIKESETFKEFFRKVRSTGESPTTDEVVKVAELFEDDLTLDNLSRPQLVSMCRYMNINAFGTDNFLRYTIRSRMRQIKEDDTVSADSICTLVHCELNLPLYFTWNQSIAAEGISVLSYSELQHACQSRGIRTIGVSEEHLRSELSQWVDLHVNRGLSGTLLILSKAFAFNRGVRETAGVDKDAEADEIMRSLKDTLASLPDNLLNEAELEVSSDSASYKQRLEVLQQQEELIEDEEEQETKETEARKLKKEAEEAAKEQAKQEELEKKRLESEEKEKLKVGEEKEQAGEMLPQAEVEAATKADAEPLVTEPEGEVTNPEDVRMTSEQVSELGQALEILSAKSSVMKEREELKKLVEENKQAEADGAVPNPLAKRLKGILAKIDQQLEAFDNEVGSRLNMFEADYEGKIAVKDLRKALEVIAHRPTDEAIEILLKKLDVDEDRFVPIDEIVALSEGEGLGIVVSEDTAASELKSDASAARSEARDWRSQGTDASTMDAASSASKDASSGTSSDSSSSKKKDKQPKLKKEDVVED
ncbi:BQ2448_2048 [Microbotryum intermedium]|uniref:Mitochondrial proton/calcium exchanger protein n=1 Tax=Microbotryum intermedium TaxID=269621 RepID=A0A238FD12_9BASI|nr:BQ2448_2048 [Microbotryum intermedium]